MVVCPPHMHVCVRQVYSCMCLFEWLGREAGKWLPSLHENCLGIS